VLGTDSAVLLVFLSYARRKGVVPSQFLQREAMVCGCTICVTASALDGRMQRRIAAKSLSPPRAPRSPKLQGILRALGVRGGERLLAA
jgi:hypothetical protein